MLGIFSVIFSPINTHSRKAKVDTSTLFYLVSKSYKKSSESPYISHIYRVTTKSDSCRMINRGSFLRIHRLGVNIIYKKVVSIFDKKKNYYRPVYLLPPLRKKVTLIENWPLHKHLLFTNWQWVGKWLINQVIRAIKNCKLEKDTFYNKNINISIRLSIPCVVSRDWGGCKQTFKRKMKCNCLPSLIILRVTFGLSWETFTTFSFDEVWIVIIL